MKTIYTFIFSFIISIPAFSQECDSLFSPCVGTFSRNGFYFNLEAVNDVTVSSFSYMVQNAGTRDISIYYRQGTYLGYEGVASNWTLLGTQTNITPVNGGSCPLPLNAMDIQFGICIPQGQVYGFYFVMSSGTGTLESHNTLPESSIGAQDANLKLITGKGQFGMGDFAGTLLSGLTFQGSIHYACGCVTSVSNESTVSGIELYPNPASDELIVRSSEFGDKTLIEIYDVLGQHIFSQKPEAKSHQLFINVSSLSFGIYFAHLLQNDGRVTRIKFIKE